MNLGLCSCHQFLANMRPSCPVCAGHGSYLERFMEKTAAMSPMEVRHQESYSLFGR